MTAYLSVPYPKETILARADDSLVQRPPDSTGDPALRAYKLHHRVGNCTKAKIHAISMLCELTAIQCFGVHMQLTKVQLCGVS